MDKLNLKLVSSFILTIFLVPYLSGCNLPTQAPISNNPEFTPVSDIQQTKLTFRLTIPEAVPAGDSIYITLLDEVTGLAFNQHKYIMQAEDALHYSATLPFYLGKVLKYRYSRQGTFVVDEHLYDERPVRYRLYHVEGPATVDDVLSQWTDSNYQGPTGRIMGTVADRSTGLPIPNIMVVAGGAQAFTLADGSFLLEGLPPGTHNLMFYSLDGAYNIYQQGAAVAADSTTPVAIDLNPAKLITVIFTITVPAETPADVPIRMAGNLWQLGNTFADLAGGVSSLPARMPQLGRLSDGRYMVTLSLPAGAYIEYKYTLGDGLWSSELANDGAFRLRQVILPNSDLEITEAVDTWNNAGSSPIRFEVKIPENTPPGNTVSIQLNPGFGWLEPLPMWLGQDALAQPVWKFFLTGPFNNMPSLRYRYCRQAQCGIADDAATIGVDPPGRVIDPRTNPGSIVDQIERWNWYSGPYNVPSVPDITVVQRQPGFIAGVSFSSGYKPSWDTLLSQASQDVQNLGVNWLILTPTWTFTNNTPPILEQNPAQDMLWPDLLSVIHSGQGSGLNVGLFPTPNFPFTSVQWWQSAKRDYPWWVSFFERYSSFIQYHATIAATTNANSLILGGNWLDPALPAGKLADGSPSNVPQNAEEIWRGLIGKIRQYYSGSIAWVLTYPEGVQNPPPFLDAVDQIYVLWSAALATQPGASLDEMQSQAAATLDQDILPLAQLSGKPIVIAVSYPSIDRGATGCIAIQGGGCLDYGLLTPPNTDISVLNLDLPTQANAYNAVLAAINEREWISGYVSMGYYPPAELQDKSVSIHGKPASGVLWYWSTKFLGK